jgi:uncharacterized protein (TIGR02996 family)
MPSLYRRILGSAFDTLPPALQDFHDVETEWRGHSLFTVTRSPGRLRGLVADVGGLPRAGQVPMRVVLRTEGERERWIRHFGTTKLESVQCHTRAGWGRWPGPRRSAGTMAAPSWSGPLRRSWGCSCSTRDWSKREILPSPSEWNMSLTNAFLQAIIAEPEDDTPRLIYADWLEDHAGPDGAARAALIRAQVRLGQLPEEHPDRPALEDEADDLLAQHEERWAAEVSRIALEWDWRRGFIEQVTVSADAFREQGEELLARNPVREVRLLGGEDEIAAAGCRHLECIETLDLSAGSPTSVFRVSSFRDHPLSRLLASPHLGKLRALNLLGQGIEGSAIRTLVSTGLLARLERLDLCGNRALGDRGIHLLLETGADHLEELGVIGTNLTAHGVRGLFEAEWPRLRRLNVNGGMAVRPGAVWGDLRNLLSSPLVRRLENLFLFASGNSPAEGLLREVAGSDALDNLKELSLSGKGVLLDDLQALGRSSGLAGLRKLALLGGTLGPAEIAILAGKALPELRQLKLGGNQIRDTGTQALVASGFLPGLTRLDLSQNRIGGPGLEAIRAVKGAALRWLDLSENWVGSGGAELLAGSDLARALTHLSLNQCNLGPAGAKALAGSPHLSRLRVLSLQHNRLGNEGVQALAASPHLSRLRELHLDGNDLDTPAALALLESPYLGRVRKLGLRGSYFAYTEHERLRARFGEGVVF